MARKQSTTTPVEEGDYEIVVEKGHSGGFFHESPNKYYAGRLYFRAADGKFHLTGVDKISLRFRKTFWCVPGDVELDDAARTAEYKRYVPALELYRTFRRRTGKRYELVRVSDGGFPLLPSDRALAHCEPTVRPSRR